MTKESNIIMCFPMKRVGALDDPSVIKDSIRDNCSECNEVILVSPSSMKIHEQTGASLVCSDCVGKMNDLELVPVTEEQAREIQKHNLRNSN